MRDSALAEITNKLTKSRVWFADSERHTRMVWEGIFYMFWHSDKSVYQRECSLKIAQILIELAPSQQGWSEQ